MVNLMLCVVCYIVGKHPFTNKLFGRNIHFLSFILRHLCFASHFLTVRWDTQQAPADHCLLGHTAGSSRPLSAGTHAAGSSRPLSARTHAAGSSRPLSTGTRSGLQQTTVCSGTRSGFQQTILILVLFR